MKSLRLPLIIVLVIMAGQAFNASARNNPVLYTFGSYPTDGTHPLDSLVQGSDGNFYGTTSGGGSNNAGIVFTITAQGTLSALHSFNGDDGYGPWASLVQGSDSNFYGTTEYGGASNAGGAFQITSAGTLTLLHSFTGSDGQYPLAGLVQGSDSNFYGTTSVGGTNSAGTVFKMTAQGTLTTLYQFSGGSDGSNIWAGLVQGSDGNFYGTTKEGGLLGLGTVFQITAQGTLTTLYQFSGSYGDTPLASLVQGSDSNFYGTTSGGGPHGAGIVFRISSIGAFTTLHSFTGPDGNGPAARLAQGLDGNFYGTTFGGGTSTNCGGGCGTAFQITSAGTLTVLDSFSGSDGSSLRAGLVQGSDSNFYGTSSYGGTNDDGTVFKLIVPFPNSWISAGNGKWETGTNWSLGAAPSTADAADFVTNASTKTVTIDATTTNTPSALILNNLYIAGTANSTNTLFLNNVGTNMPLQVLGTNNVLTLDTNGALAVNNSAIVATNGSAQLTIGNTGGGASLTITNGGVVSATVLVVGASGQGKLVLSNGTVTVNQLVLTNGVNSVFTFSDGTLTSGGTLVTNNQLFAVGDGTDAAAFQLNGGVHNFANSLEIRTNATLTGCGTINGNVVVDPGGAVQANCGGAINFSGGTLTNNGTVTASNSTVLNFYVPVVNSGVIDATGGSVHFFSTLTGSGSVLLPPTNSWIDGSGKWETGTNWSSGVAPSLADSADSIGNAGNNTITIDATTSSSFPSSLTISNLIVGAPGPFTNALVLSNAGTNTPLVVLTSVSVIHHGSVILTNSALQVGGASGGALTVDGQLTMNSGTIWVSSNLLVGLSNPLSLVTIRAGALYVTNAAHNAVTEVRYGTLVLTGGVFLTDSLLITNTGATFLNDGGTFTITGLAQVDQGTQTVASGTTQFSSNLVVGTSANSTGTVNVTGGQLIVTNAPITIGNLGVGSMTVSNGTVSTTGVGIGAGTNSQGTLTLQDGSTMTVSSNLTAGSASGATGTVSVTGGQLVATNGVIGVGNDGTATNGFGVGTVTVSSGTVLANQILLGSSVGGQGQLTVQPGGLVSLVGTNAQLVANDLTVDGGDVEILNGQIYCGKLHPGAMTMSSGTANCQTTYVGYDSQGTLTVVAGQMTVSSLLEVGFTSGSAGSVWMSGGQLTAASLATTIGNQGVGQMSISNGIVTMADVFVGNSSNPGTLTLAGGTLTVNSLVLLTPSSQFNFTGGRLNALGITNSNGQLLTLGNGVSPITLNLLGGISSLGNGLKISANATVSGFGTINGNLDNYGLLSPGNGVLNFTGGVLTNYGTILATAGGAINFSGTVVNNGLVLTNGGIHFLGGLVNNGLLLDPTADSDGDGMNNLSEALAGTNPTNSASLFRITAIATLGNDVLVTWTTVGGHSYVVQSAPITSGGYSSNFTDLSAVMLVPETGESTTNYLDVGGAMNVPSRFYHVRLVP